MVSLFCDVKTIASKAHCVSNNRFAERLLSAHSVTGIRCSSIARLAGAFEEVTDAQAWSYHVRKHKWPVCAPV